MADEVFLIRHGQSMFNALDEAKGADPFHVDARLSPLGHQQVAAARAEAQRLGPDLVVVSPLTRAVETGLGLAFGHLGDPWWYHLDPDDRGVPREPDEIVNRRVAAHIQFLQSRAPTDPNGRCEDNTRNEAYRHHRHPADARRAVGMRQHGVD